MNEFKFLLLKAYSKILLSQCNQEKLTVLQPIVRPRCYNALEIYEILK